jgi:hypothetical protein
MQECRGELLVVTATNGRRYPNWSEGFPVFMGLRHVISNCSKTVMSKKEWNEMQNNRQFRARHAKLNAHSLPPDLAICDLSYATVEMLVYKAPKEKRKLLTSLGYSSVSMQLLRVQFN